ncbi:glycoside hydrolase family 2 TIM barrel-domain containing protein [Ruthenibacterium lactatiformans]|uniref:glycoside hydrolase family 2 TIM barrel-domain containing protein n=1 Tax=Ruthenibacterium lactatiformans TaxID=1550024 RepID=UPI0022E4BFA2|nr:glycoside hydrolase family 2 TIM barrel-domain containing protein [Ruthenibacterium lactatiformans]
MKKTRLNDGWFFYREGEATAVPVRVPHDAMIVEKRTPDAATGNGGAFFPGGKYIYTRTLFGEMDWAEQTVILEFEGVYMNSTVLLNGEQVGGWYYGYTNFFVDLTSKLKIGAKNELMVIADNSKVPNARWYTGSGIYRPVNLWVGGMTHIFPQSLRVKTLSIDPAIVEISTEIENAEVSYEILDGEKAVASASGKTAVVSIPDAKLWSAENPNLYTVKAVVKKNGAIVDEAIERFGIRTLAWSAKKGLEINGRTVKLKGGCIHHDNGILGACTYKDAEKRKVRKLKEFGFNAIRFSHYPAGKDLLDACDEVGIYVMDESFDQWRAQKTKYDYSHRFDAECEKDIAALADKDFNHPCVILYSIGNEIPDTGREFAPGIARRLTAILKEHDGTRPVTIGNNAPMSMVAEAMQDFEREKGAAVGSLEINELITAHPELLDAFKKGKYSAETLERVTGNVFDELDIAGHNYAHEFYEGIHTIRPDRILLSAETFPARMASNWRSVEENDYIIGDFHWTAWDYLGEVGVGLPVYGTKEAPFSKPYPCLTAACGSFDLNGTPEAAAYYCAALWGAKKTPFIGVRPVDHSGEEFTIGSWRLTDAIDCWTWDGNEGRKAEIIVYGVGTEVELTQDSVSLGRKPLTDCKAEFEAVYEPGILQAITYDENGIELGRSVLKTNGKEVLLAVQPEKLLIRAAEDALVYIPIQLVDEEGVLRMNTEKRINVRVSGAGELLALGSARYENEETFQSMAHLSWRGSVLAIVRSTGKPGRITVTASADGCEDATAEIRCE